MLNRQLLAELRITFNKKINILLTSQSETYRKAAGFISKNEQLQQDIFENLALILRSNNLEDAKKYAASALHASHELDSSVHFLLSYRAVEQKLRETEIENLMREFNNTLDSIEKNAGVNS